MLLKTADRFSPYFRVRTVNSDSRKACFLRFDGAMPVRSKRSDAISAGYVLMIPSLVSTHTSMSLLPKRTCVTGRDGSCPCLGSSSSNMTANCMFFVLCASLRLHPTGGSLGRSLRSSPSPTWNWMHPTSFKRWNAASVGSSQPTQCHGLHHAASSLRLRVPRDYVCAHWKGSAGSGAPYLTCQEIGADGFIDFAVPASAISANFKQTVSVSYTVLREGQTT